jgi:hypothetical protein
MVEDWYRRLMIGIKHSVADAWETRKEVGLINRTAIAPYDSRAAFLPLVEELISTGRLSQFQSVGGCKCVFCEICFRCPAFRLVNRSSGPRHWQDIATSKSHHVEHIEAARHALTN